MRLLRFSAPGLRKLCSIFLPGFLGLALDANAANLRLISGETYDGKLQFANNQILVGGRGGTAVDLSNVLDALFKEPHRQLEAGALPAGAMLINGTVVAGQPGPMEDPMKIGEATIPLSSIAWVLYLPIAREKIITPTPGQTGAILTGGDFFPGTIGAVKDDKIAVNSVLFGPQRFLIKGVHSQIAGLVLHDLRANAGRYQVTAKGGVYQVDAINTDASGIVIHDSILGDVHIGAEAIFEIGLAKQQYQFLTALKPDLAVPAGVDATAAVQTPQNPADPDAVTLQTAPNVALSYAVPAGFTVFSASVSLPPAAPAGTHVTFAIYGDGKFLVARSTPVSPGDNAQHLRFAIGNVHTLTLRVEPAGPLPAGAIMGQWAQPMFLRP
jgi:hypothetical protein